MLNEGNVSPDNGSICFEMTWGVRWPTKRGLYVQSLLEFISSGRTAYEKTTDDKVHSRMRRKEELEI